MPDERAFCTMIVDDQLFGVDVIQVQEIIGEQHITPVPLGPPTAVGLLNLRGEIVPAISLRTALGLPEPADPRTCKHVVVRRPSGLASIVVDRIGEVVDVDGSSYEPAPDTLSGRARELVRGVHKLERRLLLELDVARALAVNGGASD
jgi:purine-binding chemotaxis protein CheW